MSDIDWVKIKTEYVTTSISQRELANKYNLSLSGISKKAKAEDWVKKRESYQNRRATKVERKVIERDAEKVWTQMERLAKATDKLLEKVEIAIEQLDKVIVVETVNTVKNVKLKNGNKRVTTKSRKAKSSKVSVLDRKGLQELSTTLKNIKDIITVTGDGDEDESGGVIEIAAIMKPPEDQQTVETGVYTESEADGVIVYE